MVRSPSLSLITRHHLAPKPPPKHTTKRAQSLELYRQLGALLGRMNRWLQVRRWDWRRTGALRRPRFEWNVQHLPATFARVRPSLLALPSMDV